MPMDSRATTPPLSSLAPGCLGPWYHLRYPGTAEHFYTMSDHERDGALDIGYGFQGVAAYICESSAQGTIPLYRLFDGATGVRVYTADAGERDALITDRGFSDDGISGYLFPEKLGGTVPLFRLSLASIGFFYTTSKATRDRAVDDGWSFDGVVGYVFPAH